ncbi:hypothetical protein QUF75_15820 [Desulfococcaceae bacterium HSG7]|nr:hypothetical protein [Desulfococcaceae bacterium HSG7]
MKIELKLNKYCIETAAKKAYEYFLSECFKKNHDPTVEEQIVLETRIESLKYFLENADFRFLRSQHPELNGLKGAKVFLVIPQNKNAITVRCNTQIITPKWRNEISSNHLQDKNN